jgi:hypothetical protein
MLIELVEEGLEAQQQKEKSFFELAERFRAAADPKEVERPWRRTRTDGFRQVMPKSTRWAAFPSALRQHLIERMRDRSITLGRSQSTQTVDRIRSR